MEITFQTRDEFKREAIADNLIKLIESEISISPVVVDGPWGCGKTEFCHKMINKIKEKNEWNTVYIDSFRFDHVEDPLMMLITQITSSLPESPEKSELIKRAVPVVKVMGKVLGKAAISWALKQNAEDIADELEGAVEKTSESLFEMGIERVFKDFEEVEENLNVFKVSLENVTKDKKLIIFIDELDRCRPLFGLSLLEKVKHVFDVNGVEFVFFANLQQVQSMVKKQYGFSIDAETYLSKFFPLSVKLPNNHDVSQYDSQDNAFQLFLNNVSTHDQFKSFFTNQSSISSIYNSLFIKDEISLRDSEKFYNNMLIYNAISKNPIAENKIWMYVILWFMGVYIYTFKPELTKKLLTRSYTADDIVAFLGIDVVDFKNGEGSRNLFNEIFALFLLELPESEYSTLIPNKDKLKYWQESVRDLFRGGGGGSGRGERVDIVRGAIKTMQLC